MNTKVDEGKLISGKEALIALANGEEVEYINSCTPSWHELSVSGISINEIVNPKFNKFRLKTRTISINGIEVPSVRYIAHSGGNCVKISCHCPEDARVVNAALRQVFGGSHDN